MDTHEVVAWKGLFKCFHAQECHDGFIRAFGIDLDIVLESFDVEDVGDADLHEFVFALDNDIFTGFFRRFPKTAFSEEA